VCLRRFWIIMAGMIGLTDTQLQVVMQAACLLPVEKREFCSDLKRFRPPTLVSKLSNC
jgi:hypothetical protein